MFDTDEIYSVSSFLNLCKKTIDSNMPTCWLKGEISNFSAPQSGHWYFSLKDNHGQIRCALFRLSQKNLNFTPENGMEVLLRASPTLYESRGDFQIIVEHIENIGSGNLALEFEKLKKKLFKEGLFEESLKKEIPKFNSSIAIISSQSGSVIHDIVNTINKRFPFLELTLYDTQVQGVTAHQQIIESLVKADKNSHDLIILARGGGSIEDLWAFNDESLARAIFKLNTPIISAIGHETDFTISDFVSDMRAATPTAAAVLATPDRLELLNQFEFYESSLINLINKKVETLKNNLGYISQSLTSPVTLINQNAQQIDDLNALMNKAIHEKIEKNNSKINYLFMQLKANSPIKKIKDKLEISNLLSSRLENNINNVISNNYRFFKELQLKLTNRVERNYEINHNKFKILTSNLNTLSPLATIERGFSITMDQKKSVIKDINQINVKDKIYTRLKDATITSSVEKISKN